MPSIYDDKFKELFTTGVFFPDYPVIRKINRVKIGGDTKACSKTAIEAGKRSNTCLYLS